MGLTEENEARSSPVRQRPVGVRRRVGGAVLALIVVNTAIELALSLSDAGLGLPRGLRVIAFHFGAFSPSLLTGAPPAFGLQPETMFISYAFLHGGLAHLALNMLALYLFGAAIVDRIGTTRFLIAYAVSAVFGAVGFALLGNGITPMVGASGALFGLLGVWSCWDFMDKRFYRANMWEIVRPLLYLLLYNLAFMALLQGQLAWEAHLGGFIAGWVLALCWGRPIYRRLHTRSPASRDDC
ncbi:MAG: rhomboid family intramembrane serine protease [Rhodobacteraceae bacterium]|nr:rhomboid family intramembrane serine protease [Paracoccaceae bacterium]